MVRIRDLGRPEGRHVRSGLSMVLVSVILAGCAASTATLAPTGALTAAPTVAPTVAPTPGPTPAWGAGCPTTGGTLNVATDADTTECCTGLTIRSIWPRTLFNGSASPASVPTARAPSPTCPILGRVERLQDVHLPSS